MSSEREKYHSLNCNNKHEQCPKCNSKEISLIEESKSISRHRIYLKCECNICDHQFTFIYTISSYFDKWINESN